MMAAVRFAGWTGDRKVKRKIGRLQSALQAEGIVSVGNPILAQYDPPLRLPFWRRNEILVEVNWGSP